MTNINPLGDRVLIKRSKALASKGGILLPETAQEKPKEGVILAVGPGKINDKGEVERLDLEVGQRVLFSSYSGTEVKSENNKEDEELLILSVNDILGILN